MESIITQYSKRNSENEISNDQSNMGEEKLLTEYEIKIKVTTEELDASQFGSMADVMKLLDRIIEEVKKQGYKESY